MTSEGDSCRAPVSDASYATVQASEASQDLQEVNRRRPRSKSVLYRCPHCRSTATVRSSREVTLTLRELTYQCSNAECGHTYVVNMEFARTLSPSATPNLALKLPISTHVRERLVRQLELLP